MDKICIAERIYLRAMKKEMLDHIQEILGKHAGREMRIARCVPLGGGSINAAYKLSAGNRDFFIKHNDSKKFPGMFDRESRGLSLLASTRTLRVPEFIASGTFGTQDFLILEFLDRGKPVADFWKDFGTQLAALHAHTQTDFGLDHDNYIGSLPQVNAMKKDFITFFIENRLQPQLEMAAGKQPRMLELVPSFEHLFKRLPEIIPEEKPALLHGDLWSGNFLVGPEGKACIIDPAVHYGHRESDLAMSKLFGGFDDTFYRAYHDAFPLAKGWKDRVELFNLYPLLVHVNLFGGGYVQQVAAVVRMFS
jgi:protein-ribulosamine 3-kinase